MKEFIATVRRVRQQLTVIFVCAIILVLCIEFWWKYESPVFGWTKAGKAADLTTNFLLSYIASYIFFFIGDHWDRTRDRKHIEPRVNARIANILMYFNNAMITLVELKSKTSFSAVPLNKIERKVWPEFFGEAFWIRDPSERATVTLFEHALIDWLHYGERVGEPASEVVQLFEHYDAEWTALLDEIHQNSKALAGLQIAINVYRKFQFEQTLDVASQKLEPTIYMQCFNIYKALEYGGILVDLTKDVRDTHVQFLRKGCLRFLNMKGTYNHNEAIRNGKI